MPQFAVEQRRVLPLQSGSSSSLHWRLADWLTNSSEETRKRNCFVSRNWKLSLVIFLRRTVLGVVVALLEWFRKVRKLCSVLDSSDALPCIYIDQISEGRQVIFSKTVSVAVVPVTWKHFLLLNCHKLVCTSMWSCKIFQSDRVAPDFFKNEKRGKNIDTVFVENHWRASEISSFLIDFSFSIWKAPKHFNMHV